MRTCHIWSVGEGLNVGGKDVDRNGIKVPAGGDVLTVQYCWIITTEGNLGKEKEFKKYRRGTSIILQVL